MNWFTHAFSTPVARMTGIDFVVLIACVLLGGVLLLVLFWAIVLGLPGYLWRRITPGLAASRAAKRIDRLNERSRNN